MSYYFGSQEPSFTDIYHHGILGQKWGVRRFQNEDGTLTEEGRKRYRAESDKQLKQLSRKLDKASWDERDGIINEIANNSIVQDTFNETFTEKDISEMSTLSSEFYDIRRNFNNLKNGTAQKNTLVSCMYYLGKNRSGEDLATYYDWYMYDDGDQGYMNTDVVACILNNKADAINKSNKLVENYYNKESEFKSKMNVHSDVLGRWSDEIAESIISKTSPNILKGLYVSRNIQEGTPIPFFIKSSESDVKVEIKSYGSKLKNMSAFKDDFPKSGQLSDAMDALNLNNKAIGDFTDSDWSKINEFIAKENY